MLGFGIIAVFKVISLKTGDGELHRPCLFSEFFPPFPSPTATSDTPGFVTMRGWKNREDVTGNYFFLRKKKWRKVERFESYGMLCLHLTFEVQSFNRALCKTHQAESHYYNIIILLKNLQVKMNGNTLEICCLVWPKTLVWRRAWEPMCKPALFCHIWVQPAVTPEKLQSCMGREFSVPVKHLALWNPECVLEALARTFTFGEGNWGMRSVANAQRQQSSLGWSLEICRHANERPQTDKKDIYFHISFLRVLSWELHINGAIGVSRSLCCSWALLPLLLDL